MRGKGRSHNQLQCSRNRLCIQNQNQQRTQDIKHCHKRHNQFRCTGYRLNPAKYHARHCHCHYDSDNPHRNAKGFTGGFCNGIDLRKGSAAQHSSHNSKERKKLCQPFPFLSHAVLYVIHGAAANLSILIYGTVFHCQNPLCIFGCHA